MPGHETAGGYQLRVTHRCLTEDLGFREDDAASALETLATRSTLGGEFLRTFLDKRGVSPTPSDEDVLNGLAAGTPSMYPLRRGDQQRGVTWYDQRSQVVWLVAGHHAHKSGAATDSYRYFRGLTRADLLPTRRDMTALQTERAEEEADRIWDDVPRLMDAAAASRNTEVRGHVGRVPIGMVMTADTPPHLYLAVSRKWERVGTNPPEAWVFALLTRCYGHRYEDVGHLPVDVAMPDRAAVDEDIYADFVTDWPRT